MDFQQRYDTKKKTHVLTLSSPSMARLYFGDKRHLSLKQNKVIEAIQCKIDIGRNLIPLKKLPYDNMVSAINNYNSVENQLNLKKVDRSIDKLDKDIKKKSTAWSKSEIADKDDVDSKMPAERSAQFGVEKSSHFKKMCGVASTLSNEACTEVDKDDFFNNYFNPTKRGNSVDKTHRDKVKEVYTKIQNALNTTVSLKFKNNYNKRCFVYAFVNRYDTTHNINLAPQYQVAQDSGKNSKPGVIIHEMSHFNDIGKTKDHAYGNKAKSLDITKAIENADTYEYAAEKAW